MLVLAVDTTLAACSVAAAEDGRLLARRHEALARGHAERLVPMLEEIRGEAGVGYGDFDHLAVTVGPGSFAGVRVGLSAVRALTLAEGVPAFGISTLTALAWHEAAGKPVLAAIDARRGEVYAQLFDAERHEVGAPALLSIAEALALATGPAGRVVGSATALLLPGLAGWQASTAPEIPDAGVIALHCSRLSGPPPEALAPRPLYLRAPDAKLPAAAS